DLLWAFPANRLAAPRTIDLAWGTVVQRLVRTLLVVEQEVGRQTRLQIYNMLIILNVDCLVFHAPPQPLHEHVVQRTPPTVTAHRAPRPPQPAGVLPRRELRSLVGVEDLRTAPLKRFVQRLQAETHVQRIRQPP